MGEDMEKVRRGLLCVFLCVGILCLWGCEGVLQIEDFRRSDFRAQVVIHRGEAEEQALLTVFAPKAGQRSLSLEWVAPTDLSGLRLIWENGECFADWYGVKTEGTLLLSATGDWDEWLAEGEWKVITRTLYRGREAILVVLPCDGILYMDQEGRIPLGIMAGDTEWEFLSFERVE